MGAGASKNLDGGSHGSEERDENLNQAGGQLYISLKMENFKLRGELVPHIYGSAPLVGSWDSSKAVTVLFPLLPFILSFSLQQSLILNLTFMVP